MSLVSIRPTDARPLGDRVLIGHSAKGQRDLAMVTREEADSLWVLERAVAELRKAVALGNTRDVRAFIGRLQRHTSTLPRQLHRAAELVRCQLCPAMVPIESLAHHKATECPCRDGQPKG